MKKKATTAQSVKLPPNCKPIPAKLKEHFPDDHVILNIKPDGLCGVTCGSVHIFAQQNGQEFRRAINKHFVSHWDYYKNKIHFPFKRQIGVVGQVVEFNDPFEFQNFLLSSDSDLLWSDAEEIQAICNMYQLKATVVKVAEKKDDPPIIAQLGPDTDITQFGLPHTLHIGPGQVPHMFLLLQGGHYDLAVPRDSIREKYTPHPEGVVNDDDGYMAEKEEDDPENEPLRTMDEKLTDIEEQYKKLKHEYMKSQHEIKSLRAYIREIKDNLKSHEDSDGSDVEYLTNSKSKGFRKTSPQSQAETNLGCPVCKITFTNTLNLRKHMKSHNKDGDWTCEKCSFQTINEDILKEHEKNAHYLRQTKLPTTSNSPRKTFDCASNGEEHTDWP